MKKLLFIALCMMSSQLLTAQTVGPLIQTQWDQGDPYNLMFPEIDGQRCLTSCGTTAIAQICYYYRWPEHGDNFLGYLRTNDGQSIEVNRANDYYEYDKMLLTYDENSSEESKMAVALLMRDISSTGAVLGTDLSTSPAPSSLLYYFGYDKGLIHLPAGYFSQEDMKTIIRSELDAGRPVYVGGSNGFTGHSFICDGYNDKGEFHFNYGWSGKSDGWSTLENCLFPINMEMDFNIKKDEGGAPGFALCSNKDFKWIDSNRIYGNYKFEAYNGYLMELQIALAVENTDTHEVQYFFHTNKNPNSNHDLELIWEMDADLADGTYILYPVGHDVEYYNDWKRAYFRDDCQGEISLTVKDGVKTFANNKMNDNVKEGAIDVEGFCYELNETEGTATFTYRNDKYSSYSGNIVIPETITVDGKTYAVTAIGREAFKDCHYLGDVIIGKNVALIGWDAFGNVVANKVSFAEGSQLKIIDDYGFYCSNIKEIILPEGLEAIGDVAFANSNLRSLTIPSTVTVWGGYCFNTTSLVDVHVSHTTPPILNDGVFSDNGDEVFTNHSVDGYVKYGPKSSVLYVPAGTKNAYAQADVWKGFGFILEPDDDDGFVKQISFDSYEVDGIFYQFNGLQCLARVSGVNKDLEDVIIKKTIIMGEKELTVIGISCESMKESSYNRVFIPATIETIRTWAFDNVEIGSIEFEEGSHLKMVEDDGFYDISLKAPLVLPEGLESLGAMRCKDVADVTIPASASLPGYSYYFAKLKHLRVFWQKPEPIQMYLEQFDDDLTLHVPVGTTKNYVRTYGWNYFPNIVEGNGEASVLEGDANGDGVVNAADIVEVVNYIMGSPSEKFDENAADVNGDKYVNAADIVGIVNLIMAM